MTYNKVMLRQMTTNLNKTKVAILYYLVFQNYFQLCKVLNNDVRNYESIRINIGILKEIVRPYIKLNKKSEPMKEKKVNMIL